MYTVKDRQGYPQLPQNVLRYLSDHLSLTRLEMGDSVQGC